jgi:hypothetical protein
MLIYETNLAEKLFGYAISREFIKYSSPLCDLLDDPSLSLDFDLAINFNQAINGNLSARETFTNTFMLCSGYLDPATINFYTAKMMNYPIFTYEVDRIRETFNNIDNLPKTFRGINADTRNSRDSAGNPINPNSTTNGDFNSKLKAAIKDCINAPCNPFSPQSNSIGKTTQILPTMNSASMLSMDSLKDSMASVINGLDLAVFHKIPEAFQYGIMTLSKTCSDAWGAIQGSMISEEEKPIFINAAETGETLRTNISPYKYTPDIKSYIDISTTAPEILTDISKKLGPCFSRYEYALKYNPYDPMQNKKSVSVTPITYNVNGASYSGNSLGQSDRTSTSDSNALGYRKTNITNKPYTDGVLVSDEIELLASSSSGYRYTMFASWIDEETKSIWVDSYAATSDDVATREGVANIGQVLTPSIQGITHDTQLVDDCMNRSKTDQNNGYSGRWSRGTKNNTDLTTINTSMFNHGVAFNEGLVNALIAKTGVSLSLNKFTTLARNNNLFAYVTYNGKSELIQLIDRKGSSNGGERIIDFTPYAFYKVTNKKPISRQSVPYKTWTEKTVSGVPNVGSMFVKICVGSKSQVLAALNKPNTVGGSINQLIKDAQALKFSDSTTKKVDLPVLPNAAQASTGEPDSTLFPPTN